MKPCILLLLITFLSGCATSQEPLEPEPPIFSIDKERILSICHAAIQEKYPETDLESLDLQQISTHLNPEVAGPGTLLNPQENRVVATFLENEKQATAKETTLVQGKSITVTLSESGEVLNLLKGKFSSFSSSTSTGDIKTIERVMKMNFQK